PQRTVKVFGVVGHHRPQRSQLPFAPFHGTGGAGPEVVAMSGDQGGEIGDAHGLLLRVGEVRDQGEFPRHGGGGTGMARWPAGNQFFWTAFTTMVPLMCLPWTLQWYLNSPSFPNFTGFDDLSGSTSSVSKVFPSSSDTAVCVVRALFIHTTESPTLISSFLGSKLRLFIVTVIGLVASGFFSSALFS